MLNAVNKSADGAAGDLRSQTDQPVIALHDIHKSYGTLDVIKGVDLAAHKGDVIALIGSSGSGKSTLLRCINLLETCQAGEIVFQGEPVRWRDHRGGRQPADARQVRDIRTQLSMVFQSFNLWAHMNILQNVIEAPVTVLRQPADEARAAGMALLDKVGIADKAERYPSELSGGQQQRAAIARALAMQPAAMLFDEPTSALDPELEAEVVSVIRSLALEGRTMIIVTHDMKMARDVASHVVFLHNGKIEEQGTPDDVFGGTRSKRLIQFLDATGQRQENRA